MEIIRRRTECLRVQEKFDSKLRAPKNVGVLIFSPSSEMINGEETKKKREPGGKNSAITRVQTLPRPADASGEKEKLTKAKPLCATFSATTPAVTLLAAKSQGWKRVGRRVTAEWM